MNDPTLQNNWITATFEYEDDLLGATREVRKQGLKIVDAFTPYAVHGLDKAMGLKPSRLTWVCFLCGLTGALIALTFQHWTAAVNWPLDVGGKPWNALPSDVPVIFELMVLLAGFGSVFALFGVSQLFPGKTAKMPSMEVTNDRFVLVIDDAETDYDAASVRRLLDKYHVLNVQERLPFVSSGFSTSTDGGE